jgi:hypothetical protein
MTAGARLIDVSERPVGTLCRARRRKSGVSSLMWNALSDQGARVPYGTYLAKIVARGVDGSIVRGVVPLGLQRCRLPQATTRQRASRARTRGNAGRKWPARS